MPSRILKESICTSDTINNLSPSEEVFFYRLIVQCDDYGEIDARPAIIRSRLYPLKNIKVVHDSVILKWLTSLATANLVQVYTVNERPYLHITTWGNHQQIRAQRHKYPSIDSDGVQLVSPEIICNQLKSNDYRFPRNPIQSESNPYPNPNPNSANAEKPSIKKTYGINKNIFLTDEDYTALKTQLDGKLENLIETMSDYLKAHGKTYKDYAAALRSWAAKDAKTNGTSTNRLLSGVETGERKPKVVDYHAGLGGPRARILNPD